MVKSSFTTRMVLIILAGSLLVYLASEYYKKNMTVVSEKFEDTVPTIDVDSDIVVDAVPEPELKQEVVGDLKDKKSDDYPVMPCLLYTSPSPRDISGSRMPSSA